MEEKTLKPLKLNYPKTIKVGFAFAIVMVFWGAYDFVVPLLLENAFGLSNTLRGLIMGLDNLLSLFMLPYFGKLSDKAKVGKWGKRTPFIFFGTIATVILMVFVPITCQKQLIKADIYRYDTAQEISAETFAEWFDAAGGQKGYVDKEYLGLNKVSKEDYVRYAMAGKKYYNAYSTGLFGKTYYIYDYDADQNVTVRQMTEAEVNDYKNNPDVKMYNKYVEAGLTDYLSEQVETNITKANPATIAIYMVILLLVLIAMATFRSPAVALMPDVTPKPLRSQANAMINLVGGLGGAIAFLIYTVAFFIAPSPFVGIFACVAAAMVILLTLFLILVKEPKLLKECDLICEEYGITDEDNEKYEEEELEKELAGTKKLSASEKVIAYFRKLFKIENKEDLRTEEEKRAAYARSKKTSFILILASIFMWFMGYNAVSSNLSIYCTKTLNLPTSVATIISGVSMGISAIAFIPVGYMAVRFGRRKCIMAGFALATVSFLLLWLPIVRPGDSALLPAALFSVFYLLAGFGLIIANVNTFPMVVELSEKGSVGKYTGYYYTATMSAQAITPFIAGLFMDKFNDYTLFGYSTICVAIAIALMFFVRHGDSKPITHKLTKEEKKQIRLDAVGDPD